MTISPFTQHDVNENTKATHEHERRGGTGVLSQGLLSMIAYGVNFGASFLAIIGMMRIMGEGTYGLFALAIQIVSFTAMISDFGIGPVIMRRLAINPSSCGRILLEATAARGLLLLPTWILTLLVGWHMESSGTFFTLLNLMLLNTVISSKLPVLRGTLESFYRSQSRMGVPTITMAVDSLVLLVAVLSVPVMFRDPVMAMALYTGSNIFGAVLLLWSSLRLARRLNTEPVGIAWSNVRSLIATSAPLALYLLLTALHVTIDSIYLKLFQTYEAVGVYNAALRIMTPLAVFPTIVAISASPAFARASMSMDDEQRRRMSTLFSLGMKTLLIGSVLLAGFGLTNADLVVKLAFKTSFAGATAPMALMFLTFLPMSLNIFLVEINNARDQLRTNTRFAFLVVVVSVTLGAPLIIWQGAAGAAVAKMIAVCVGLVFLLLRSREGLVMAVKPLLGKVLLLLLLLLVPRILLDGLHPLLSNGVALLCVVSGMVLLRIYNPDELSRWKEQLRGLRRVGG